MRTMLKSSFLLQTASGFVLGVIGMVAFQPAEATQALVGHLTPALHATR
jgi:hypothetical protein